MFVIVNPQHLVKGKKYIIEDRIKYAGYYRERMYWDQLYYVFDTGVGNEHTEVRTFHCSPKYYTFYEFVSEHPQWKMERRSVNLIVRRLIGDNHFEW